MATLQPNGAVQTSVVVCGPYQGDITFVSVRGDAAKVRNLRRDPRCSVLAATDDWRSYAVVEGQARLSDSENTDADELRLLLRAAYKACGGGEHPDWEEYDRVMHQRRPVVVMVHPDRIYGLIR